MYVYSFIKAVYFFFGARTERRLAVAEEASEYAIRGRRPETPRSLTITSGTPRGSRDVHNDGNHCDKKEESDRHAKGRGNNDAALRLGREKQNYEFCQNLPTEYGSPLPGQAAFIWPHIYF